MQDEYGRLRKQIEDGLDALDELQRRLEAAEKERGEEKKKKFRLIKGGLVGAGIWAGVEWLRGSRRIAVALMATGITAGGVVVAEHPGSPGADPPAIITQPPEAEPKKRPATRPTVTPTSTPRRTSPPRKPARVTPPPEPTTTAPGTKKPVQVLTKTPTKKPTATPVVSLPVTPMAKTPSLPAEIATPDVCTINLLGVKICLPLG